MKSLNERFHELHVRCFSLYAASIFSHVQAAQTLQEVMAGDGRVNPVYRQMVVLAVRSGAAGAARYLKPEGQNSTTQADHRALTTVCFKGSKCVLSWEYYVLGSTT